MPEWGGQSGAICRDVEVRRYFLCWVQPSSVHLPSLVTSYGIPGARGGVQGTVSSKLEARSELQTSHLLLFT